MVERPVTQVWVTVELRTSSLRIWPPFFVPGQTAAAELAGRGIDAYESLPHT